MKNSNQSSRKLPFSAPVILSISVIVFGIAYLVAVAIIGPTASEVKYNDLKPVFTAIKELRSAVGVTTEEKELLHSIQEKISIARGSVESTALTVKNIDKIKSLQEIEQAVIQLSSERAKYSATMWAALNDLEDSVAVLSEKVFVPWTHQEFDQEGLFPGIKKIIGRLDPIFDELWPWPITVAFVFFSLVISGVGRDWTAKFLGRIHELKISEFFKISLSAETKDEIENNFGQAMEEGKKAVNKKYDKEVVQRDIIGKFNKVCSEKIKPWIEDNVVDSSITVDLRCTMHIPYALMDWSLYQLVDYWPPQARGKKGRILSERFGIIGMAFRTKQTIVENSIPTEPITLVEKWGMRLHEANQKSERQSMIAIPIKNNFKSVIAVVYLDSIQEGGFQLPDRSRDFKGVFSKMLIDAFNNEGLLNEIDALVSEVGRQTPQIAIHD